MHVDHQNVLLLLGQGYQRDVDHRAGGEVKCSGNGLSKGLCQLGLTHWQGRLQLDLQNRTFACILERNENQASQQS